MWFSYKTFKNSGLTPYWTLQDFPLKWKKPVNFMQPIIWCECIRRYVNSLHYWYREPPTCITHWDNLKEGVFRKICITKNNKKEWCQQKQQCHTYFDGDRLYTELEHTSFTQFNRILSVVYILTCILYLFIF